MPTKAELEAENERLRALLAENKPEESRNDIRIGDVVMLSAGIAEVRDFYDEDGHHKVRMWLTPFSKDDFETPVGEGVLCSMPIQNFRRLRDEYPSFKAQRQAELKRGAR